MVHEVGYTIEPRKSLVKRISEWVTPRSIGKFGLSICIGSREYFAGLSVSNVVMETIVKRTKSKSYKKPPELRVVDL